MCTPGLREPVHAWGAGVGEGGKSLKHAAVPRPVKVMLNVPED